MEKQNTVTAKTTHCEYCGAPAVTVEHGQAVCENCREKDFNKAASVETLVRGLVCQ